MEFIVKEYGPNGETKISTLDHASLFEFLQSQHDLREEQAGAGDQGMGKFAVFEIGDCVLDCS